MRVLRCVMPLVLSAAAMSAACAPALAASTPAQTTTVSSSVGVATTTAPTTTASTTTASTTTSGGSGVATTTTSTQATGGRPGAATAKPLTVAAGVRVGPIALGHDTKAEALAALHGFLTARLRFTFAGAYWSAPRARLGASFDPAPAVVQEALAAKPGSHLALSLTIKRAPLLSYLSQLERRFGHAAQPSVIRLVNQRAVVVPGRPRVTVNRMKMAAAIVTALRSGLDERLALLVTKTPGSTSPTKAVVVNLQTQTLTAYLNGKPLLKTPVTTGRPALPTPVGAYHALFKASPFVFNSPWPPGSPYWYPPTPVEWAIDFYDGDFLHDDPPEPDGAYGAGSEYGPYASHGCVHVPHDVMAFLFRWLPVGAQVVVAE